MRDASWSLALAASSDVLVLTTARFSADMGITGAGATGATAFLTFLLVCTMAVGAGAAADFARAMSGVPTSVKATRDAAAAKLATPLLGAVKAETDVSLLSLLSTAIMSDDDDDDDAVTGLATNAGDDNDDELKACEPTARVPNTARENFMVLVSSSWYLVGVEI